MNKVETHIRNVHVNKIITIFFHSHNPWKTIGMHTCGKQFPLSKIVIVKQYIFLLHEIMNMT